MALVFPESVEDYSSGQLSIKVIGEIIQVYFIPQKRAIADFDDDYIHQEWHLLDINSQADLLFMYPFSLRDGDSCVQKYDRLKTITFEGFKYNWMTSASDVAEMLQDFPLAFVKDFQYGLGLKREYGSIAKLADELGAEQLVISKIHPSSVHLEERTLRLEWSVFEAMRKGINRVVEGSRSVANFLKDRRTYNTLAYYLNDDKYPQKPVKVTDQLMLRLINNTVSNLNQVSDNDTDRDAIRLVKANKEKMIKEQPEEMMRLKNDLELVTLKQLIEKFESNLDKKLKEAYWQRLFNENPFILTMAFGYPIIKINDQASVGGHKIAGDGNTVVDFLIKNSISNNTALFEIKTPSTKLLMSQPYRGSVYNPSSELTGAINQVLDQKHKLEKTIVNLKDSSRMYDLESYAVHGILIVGISPTQPDQIKSLELFRGNSKNVIVITFDEVLEKLKQLYSYLHQSQEKFPTH